MRKIDGIFPLTYRDFGTQGTASCAAGAYECHTSANWHYSKVRSHRRGICMKGIKSSQSQPDIKDIKT